MVTDERISRRTVLAGAGGTALGGSLAPSVVGANAADPGDEVWSVTSRDTVGGATVVDGTAYFATAAEELFAVDATTGEEVWTFEESFHYGPSRRSPQVVGSTVYVGTNFNKFHAVDAEAGEEQWHYEAEDDFQNSPTIADGTAYTVDRDKMLYAFDAETGDIRWEIDIDQWLQGSPVVVEDTIYLVNNERRLYAFDAESGEEVWSSDSGITIVRSPTVVDGKVYASGGAGITVHDAESGSLEDEFETGSGGNRFAPTVAAGRVFAADASSDDGGENDVTAFSAADGEELWRTPVDEDVVQGPPTVADDVLYFGDRDGYVHALDADTGEQQWKTRVSPLPVEAPLIVVDGLLYVGHENTSEEGVMAALETGGDGSSEDSRVLQGVLNHHDAWTGDPSPLTAPAEASTSSSTDAENGDAADTDTDDASDGTDDDASENSVPGFGIGSGITAVGGLAYVLRRHATTERRGDR